MECMALQPQYQTITENKMIHSNIGVITNIRPDHVDVMGYTLPEIAQTIGRTIPNRSHLFTTERKVTGNLQKMAFRRKTEMHVVETDSITLKEMQGFDYIEHRENVALALSVCQHLNINRQTALEGMYKAIPDAGVLKRFKVKAFDKELNFYNGFAANDPDSTLMIWNMIRDDWGMEGVRIILLNTRHDRLDRAKQLAEMIGRKLSGEVDHVVLMGQSTEVVENLLVDHGLPGKKSHNLGWTVPARIFETMLSLTNHVSTIVAMGNMGGRGADTVEYFNHRSIKNYD